MAQEVIKKVEKFKNGNIALLSQNGDIISISDDSGLFESLEVAINNGVEFRVSYSKIKEGDEEKNQICNVLIGEHIAYHSQEHDEKTATKNTIVEDMIAFASIKDDENIILMTVNGQIIEYQKKDSEDIVKRINNAINNKIECKIYYSKDSDGNYRIYTIQAGAEMIYVSRGSLSLEHPKLDFRNSLKVTTGLDGKAALTNRGNTNNNSSEIFPAK